MLNEYEICLNTRNQPIFSMQDFIYWLCTCILICFGQVVSPTPKSVWQDDMFRCDMTDINVWQDDMFRCHITDISVWQTDMFCSVLWYDRHKYMTDWHVPLWYDRHKYMTDQHVPLWYDRQPIVRLSQLKPGFCGHAIKVMLADMSALQNVPICCADTTRSFMVAIILGCPHDHPHHHSPALPFRAAAALFPDSQLHY